MNHWAYISSIFYNDDVLPSSHYDAIPVNEIDATFDRVDKRDGLADDDGDEDDDGVTSSPHAAASAASANSTNTTNTTSSSGSSVLQRKYRKMSTGDCRPLPL